MKETMERKPEAELMNDDEQAKAYAYADFSEPHEQFVDLLTASIAPHSLIGHGLDLGCGPGDVTRRVVKRIANITVDALDGAQAMLSLAHCMTREAGLSARIQYVRGILPDCQLPQSSYDFIFSNSLLHHLGDPMVLWHVIHNYGKSGAAIFIMDLMRPLNESQAAELVTLYAAEEPEVLKRDFYNSLLAAYTVEEVEAQLGDCELEKLHVQAVSDRHLTVTGYL